MVSEDGLAESDAAHVFVDGAPGVEKANMNGIKLRIGEIPELYIAEIGQWRQHAARGLSAFRWWRKGGVVVGIERGIGGRPRPSQCRRSSSVRVALAMTLSPSRNSASIESAPLPDRFAGDVATDIERRVPA